VAVYVLEIHENLLQTFVPMRYMDIELSFVGNDDVDIFVGGISHTHGELYRYFCRIGADTGNHIIHNLAVSSDPCELRIISNSSTPSHLVIRIYCRSDQGQTLGILSEHQMIKLAD